MRERSYSYSPSPLMRHNRRSPSPRERDRKYLPTSLLVRNLRSDCRPEDLRRPFELFGILRDIYLPRDYYTGVPRGFGFVQYVDPVDAEEAKYQMDKQIFQGRQLTVIFAQEDRKKPTDMRARARLRSTSDSKYRQSDYSRSPRYSHSPRYSCSPHFSRNRSRDHRDRSTSSHRHYSRSTSTRRHYSRSISPEGYGYNEHVSHSHSPMERCSEEKRHGRKHRERSMSLSQ